MKRLLETDDRARELYRASLTARLGWLRYLEQRERPAFEAWASDKRLSIFPPPPPPPHQVENGATKDQQHSSCTASTASWPSCCTPTSAATPAPTTLFDCSASFGKTATRPACKSSTIAAES